MCDVIYCAKKKVFSYKSDTFPSHLIESGLGIKV